MGRITDEVLNSHLIEFSDEKQLLLPFVASFEVTWAKRRRAFGSEFSVYFMRPDPHMQEAFGFEREILAIYSNYPTLEPRTIQSIEQFLNDDPAKGRVDTMTVFLISDADDPVSWARQYMTSNPESRLIAGFQSNELRTKFSDAWYVRTVLATQLYQRDLFDYRLPIKSDAFFFGREDLVFDFYNTFKRSENRGLFGLRKTGKTSLLFKLERRIETSNDGTLIYVDCKYPPIRNLDWQSLLFRLSENVSKALNDSSKSSDSSPADAFMSAISKCPPDRKLAVVFDEIEYISPFSQLDDHWKKDFVPFWQTIWACQSRQRNLSVFVVGVNPSVVERDLIDGVQNPLFGIIPYHYLQGLRLDEIRRMVRTLGRRMGMKFSPDAVEYLYLRYGGHPLLTRIACSLTSRHIHENNLDLPFNITASFLESFEDTRDNELSFYSRHVISELNQFYPDEYELLEKIATGQLADFIEFAREPEYTAHLSNYGLLGKDQSGKNCISIPVVGKYLGLEVARREGRRTIIKVVQQNKRKAWLRQRIDAIDSNLDELQRAIQRNALPMLFGVVSYPESHRFFSLCVCSNESDFAAFANTCNRCFIESIEAYGTSLGKSDYFWKKIQSNYPALNEALLRIKLYRHHRVHIRLNPGVDMELQRFLHVDLEGRNPSDVSDIWFVLQQCTLDSLLVGILTELDRYS